MNTETIFRIITVVLLVTALTISAYFRRKADRAAGGELRSKEGQGLLVVLRLLSLMVALPLIGYLINPDWVAWARLSLPEPLRWAAAALAAAMIPMFYWVLSSIGNNISPVQATRQNHQLVTHGPYRWVRHPLYSAGFVFVVSLCTLTGLWVLAVGSLAPLTLLLLRTPVEEARLIDTFGDDYRNYMKRTGRFFPKLLG